MASLDQSIIDLAFLDGIMEWLKAHPEYEIVINCDSIGVLKEKASMEMDVIASFDNANQLLEWIRTHA